MSDKINKHPSLLYSQDIIDICKPLDYLNISYFAHVRVDHSGGFSALTNNAGFTEHYLNNEYYNADIHMAKKNQFGKYVIWDTIERSGESAKMHSEAAQFGVQHTFTLIESGEDHDNYYHFANASSSKSINQTYLSNLDLLKSFVMYFNHQVNQSKLLSNAYNLIFNIDKQAPGYITQSSDLSVLSEQKQRQFLQEIEYQFKNTSNKNLFSKREKECLDLYVRGKTAKEIAALLHLSKRTVEYYLSNIKIKLSVDNKSALIDKVFDVLYVPVR